MQLKCCWRSWLKRLEEEERVDVCSACDWKAITVRNCKTRSIVHSSLKVWMPSVCKAENSLLVSYLRKATLPLLKFLSPWQSIQKRHFYACRTTLSYLVVAVHGSSDLSAALRSCCCGDAVAKGEGLVAMVAGRVLEWSLRGGVELQGTLGKKSRP